MGRSDIFQVLRVARAARNAPAIISFFIFNILNKIVKKKKEKSTKRDRQAAFVTQLCSGFQTASLHVLFEPINYNLGICKLSVNSFFRKTL